MREFRSLTNSSECTKNRILNIIHAEKDFVVVNKPAGVLVHRTTKSAEPALADELVKKYPDMKGVGDAPDIRPGVVHRLDRDTSGIVVFARTQAFYDHLKECFKTGAVKKTYRALVWGETPPRGVIDIPIGLKPGTTKRSVKARNMKMIKEAKTEYVLDKVLECDGKTFSLLTIHPHTGRTHQIRVHLLAIHHAVVGDELYGRRENPFGLKRQFLHADTIEFPLPAVAGAKADSFEGRRASFGADFPEDLQAVLGLLTEK